MLKAEQMRTLPEYFNKISDPRRAAGRRHSLSNVLAIAAGAVLSGARGYKAIGQWAQDLSQRARACFNCRYVNGHYEVPSRTVLRDVLMRVEPLQLDHALSAWNAQFAGDDQALAIDGKTLRNACDANGHRTQILGVVGHQTGRCHTQQKVGTIAVGDGQKAKQTNEIGMAPTVLDHVEIGGKTITADALLTQRQLADYLRARGAHYVFTVKGNQKGLEKAIQEVFAQRGAPDYLEPPAVQHGRFEQRAIWTSTALNDYLAKEKLFPGVGQVFLIERERIDKKTGQDRGKKEVVCGITSHQPDTADAQALLAYNRGHWRIENSCHWALDWNYDEDRCNIRSGHGPENMSALRRLALGLIRANSRDSIAATMQHLARLPHLVLDYLRLHGHSASPPASGNA